MPGAPQPYQNSWCSQAPTIPDGAGAPVSLMGRFAVGVDGWIMGVRYFRDLADSFNHFGYVLEDGTATLLGIVKFRRHVAAGSGAAGWETAYFHPRIPVSASQRFMVGAWFGGGYFWYDDNALASNGFVCNDVVTDQDGMPDPNMNFSYGNPFDGFGSYQSRRYGIDLVFLPR